MKINHIGIVVKSIEESSNIYVNIGYEILGQVCVDYIQNNKLLILKNIITDERIELIEPLNKKSTVYNSKEGYHHICYEVENLDDFISKFKEDKIGVIFTPKMKAPLFNNKSIIFVYLKNNTIIEILEVR